MDLWFTSQTDVDCFVKENKLVKRKNYGDSHYPIGKKSYSYLSIPVDIIVSDFYPVCDFSNNLLSYDGEKVMINKPYDIISYLAQCELENLDHERRRYSIRDIIYELTEHQQEFYTSEDLSKIFKEEYNFSDMKLRLSNKEELEQLAMDPYKFREYELDNIILQIKSGECDVFGPYLTLGNEYNNPVTSIGLLCKQKAYLAHRRMSKY